ncbi:MAG: helix-turn-helix transcriptional regulator [Gemmatimonadota bacterium]
MVVTSSRPEVFCWLHREMLRRAHAVDSDPESGDQTGSVHFRTADMGGRRVLVVTLAVPPQELLSDSELANVLGLTPRQSEVARLMALQRTNREIAAKLNISGSTVRRHAEHVFLRLNVHKRREVEGAIRQRVLDVLDQRGSAR